jgi:hypothetical protein
MAGRRGAQVAIARPADGSQQRAAAGAARATILREGGFAAWGPPPVKDRWSASSKRAGRIGTKGGNHSPDVRFTIPDPAQMVPLGQDFLDDKVTAA